MSHLDKALELLNTVDISGAGIDYEDYLRRLQEDTMATIQEDAQYTGATPEECAEIYLGWMRKYIGEK